MAGRLWPYVGGMRAVVETMIDPTVSRWDISAVVPIVEEAGGRCTRLDGGNVLGTGR